MPIEIDQMPNSHVVIKDDEHEKNKQMQKQDEKGTKSTFNNRIL